MSAIPRRPARAAAASSIGGAVAVVLDPQPDRAGDTATDTRPPRGACRTTLSSASCATRNAARSTSRGGRPPRRRRRPSRPDLDLHPHVGPVLDPLGEPLDRRQQPHLLEHDRAPGDQQRLDLVDRRPQVRGEPLDGAARLGLGERPAERRQDLGVEVGGEPPALVLGGLGPARVAPGHQLVHEDPQQRDRGPVPPPAAVARGDPGPRPGERRPQVADQADRRQRARSRASHSQYGTRPPARPRSPGPLSAHEADRQRHDRDPHGEHDRARRAVAVVRRRPRSPPGHQRREQHEAEQRPGWMPTARASDPTPITASAAAVDPTTAAPQATAGAHDWVSTITTTAPTPQRCGTSADSGGPGGPTG